MATWSLAFVLQAVSDLDAYYLLKKSTLPMSHQLHYLQMWLEKLCKAYTRDEEFRKTHKVIAKVLPSLITEHWRRIGFARRPDIREIRKLCREIDLLHPQVDDGGNRPDNVEYPWPGSPGEIEVPALWKFRIAQRMHSEPGTLLIKAAVNLTRNFIG